MGNVVLLFKNEANLIVQDLWIYSEHEVLDFAVGILFFVDLDEVEIAFSKVQKTNVYFYVT